MDPNPPSGRLPLTPFAWLLDIALQTAWPPRPTYPGQLRTKGHLVLLQGGRDD